MGKSPQPLRVALPGFAYLAPGDPRSTAPIAFRAGGYVTLRVMATAPPPPQTPNALRVAVSWGTTVTNIVQRPDAVTVTFSDGTIADFDVVVAADGLHSSTRSLVQPTSVLSTYDTKWAGWVVWAPLGDHVQRVLGCRKLRRVLSGGRSRRHLHRRTHPPH